MFPDGADQLFRELADLISSIKRWVGQDVKAVGKFASDWIKLDILPHSLKDE